MRWFVLVPLVACAAPAPNLAPADEPIALPFDASRQFTIWLGGHRVGTATETETWSHDGVRFRREETMRFARGDTDVELVTTIDIDADPALIARRVRWTERNGRDVRSLDAVHRGGAWQVGEPASLRIDDAAVPAELVPLIVRRDHHFAGAVFLPARNFVGGTGRIDPVAPDRLVARLALAGGTIAEATIDLDRDGSPARVVDGEGVIEIRATAAQARAPFPSVDLVAATAVPITGTKRSSRLLLDGDLALPSVPGQAATTSSAGVSIALGAARPGDLPSGVDGPDRADDIRAIVAGVRDRIAPDLGATTTSIREATNATAGDCTTFALAYAALASGRGIPTRVVTGLRVDGDRLVRHRWAVSWTGRRWIAVDAAFGAVPAGGDLIGLAVHDADDAGLVAGEAALTQVRTAAWN